jgi:hypothetical protein
MIVYAANSSGVYEYLPKQQNLSTIVTGDRRSSIAQACGNAKAASAPLIVAVAYNYSLSTPSYVIGGEETYVEVGLTAQEVYLECAAWGLIANLSRADMNQTAMSEALGLANETYLYPTSIITVGHPVLSAHDVAVTNVSPSKTIVGQGYSLKINVTAANPGDYTETFSVTAYANTTAIGTQTVTLTSGDSTTITFTWNSTLGFAYGNYTISVNVTLAPGETNDWNGPFTYGTVQITKVGDLGGAYNSTNPTPTFGHFDGKVDGKDLALFLECYHGTAPAQWIYLGDLGGPLSATNPTPTFFKCDGKVNGEDLALSLMCYKA